MIHGTEIKYTHTDTLHTYNVCYHGALIGVVRWTPNGSGTWTFTSSQDKAETFGSTRLQAVGFYVEQFMKRGEEDNGRTIFNYEQQI
mgnify:CR=1 FL=1